MEHLEANLADDALLHDREPCPLGYRASEAEPHTLYRYDQYQWDYFPTLDYIPVKLTKGYFTYVERADLEKLSELKYLRAQVDTCPTTGKIIKVRAKGDDNKGRPWLLHRFLSDARKGETIDHFNHHPLDNRRSKNLRNITHGANIANSRRKSDKGLLRGVEPRGNHFGGRIQFKKEQIRSKEVWDSQEPAYLWYLQEYQRLYGHIDQGSVLTRNYPIFPPKVGEKAVSYTPF